MSLNDHIHSVGNSNIQNHFFSMYHGNIKRTEPIGTINLYNFIKDIGNPDDDTIKLVERIRATTDKTERANLKTQLSGYTPVVLCTDGRSYKHIKEFSGLMAVDFDKLPSTDYAKELRSFLMTEYPWVYCSWLSASGLGVRALLHIDMPKSIDDYKAMFRAFRYNYIEDYEIIEYFDNAPQNPVLPLFQSVDFDINYRIHAEPFTDRYTPITVPPRTTPPLNRPSTSDEKRVVNMMKSAIGKIIDNGHPQLRGASFALGGYVGAGYIDYQKAIELIDNLIDTNIYLSIKPDVYKQTARTMIKQGMSLPLYL